MVTKAITKHTKPAPAIVVLRGLPVEIDSAVGQAFCHDCCRFAEGLLDEMAIRSVYEIGGEAWIGLAKNRALLKAVERTRYGRIRDGVAVREEAQMHFLAAPREYARILNDPRQSAKSRLGAGEALRRTAAPPEEKPGDRQTGERFNITINLGADGTAHEEKYSKVLPQPKPQLTIENEEEQGERI